MSRDLSLWDLPGSLFLILGIGTFIHGCRIGKTEDRLDAIEHDASNGAGHSCEPCTLEHVALSERPSLLIPGAITPPFRHGGGDEGAGITGRVK